MLRVLDIEIGRNPREDAKVIKAKLAEFTDWSEEQKKDWLSRMIVTLAVDCIVGSSTLKALGWYVYNLIGQFNDDIKLDLTHIEGLDPTCARCKKPMQITDEYYKVGGTCDSCFEQIRKELEERNNAK